LKFSKGLNSTLKYSPSTRVANYSDIAQLYREEHS